MFVVGTQNSHFRATQGREKAGKQKGGMGVVDKARKK
jgi:hypothetical protein